MRDMAFDAFEKLSEADDIELAFGGFLAGGLKEDVVRLMAAQHIIDEVGREGDLTARLLGARLSALNKARNLGALLEGALHEEALIQPFFEVVAQHVLMEELFHIEPAQRLQPPYGDGVFAADKAEWAIAPALETAGEEHAERLVHEAAIKRIADEIMPVGAREGLDQHFVRRRDDGAELLDADPFGDLSGQTVPVLFIMKEFADTVCEEGREREFAARIIGNGGFRVV